MDAIPFYILFQSKLFFVCMQKELIYYYFILLYLTKMLFNFDSDHNHIGYGHLALLLLSITTHLERFEELTFYWQPHQTGNIEIRLCPHFFSFNSFGPSWWPIVVCVCVMLLPSVKLWKKLLASPSSVQLVFLYFAGLF